MPPDRPPRILVCNDDGYLSAGLEALVSALEPLAEVVVVAPETEQSAASHAISLRRPLRIRRVRERWYAVDGTPTDCSYVGISHVLQDQPPRLTVAGINHGPNMAEDVIYSGTVAAAMESALLDVPAIAVSLATRRDFDFGVAARFAQALAGSLLAQPLPPRLLLNVNVPPGTPDGYTVTRLGRHSYGLGVVEKTDPRGGKYYWIGGSEYQHEDVPGSDCNVVYRENQISVTPLQMDLTDDRQREVMAGWEVVGFAQRPPADRSPER
jgi:5'-nucleotidase